MTQQEEWEGGRLYPIEDYHGPGQHRMPRTHRVKETALNAFWFLVHIGRGLELALAISLALLLLGSAALGLIQIYDHFFGK